MPERNKYGDIILTKEEQNELCYRLTHPDAEAMALRDKFIEDLDRQCVIKFNTDGSIECFDKE